MKKNGRYRFTLQFPAESNEQIAVGELLESMGNRKSALIVQAVHSYMETHTELTETREFRMLISSAKERENEIRQVASGRLIEQRTTPSDIALSPTVSSFSSQVLDLELSLDSMLDNLSLFQ